MTVFFVDTSALGKRYLAEPGSAWVLSWIERPAGNIITVAEIAQVEMFSLLARRIRERTLTAANAARLQADFLLHAEKEYLVVPIDSSALAQAHDLVTKYPLRALDAIQLSSALHALAILKDPMTFITADKNLLAAAAAGGFAVDDPNAHP